jgi:GT2 family glycosyltransferase
VVLNYRGADDTVRCVASLRSSTRPARIVVVDNGSHDGSAERLRTLEGVELIESDRNLGFAGGANLGIERLVDEVGFVWVLNNDTVVEPPTLDALLRAADRDPRIGAVGSVLYRTDEPAVVLTWGGGSLGRFTGHTQDATGPGGRLDYLTAASLLLRSAAVREVGCFDERYFFTWEDVDLCARLRAGGWRLAVADDARVWHRWGGSAAPLSSLRVREHAAGVVVFMRKTSRVPWITSVPLLGYYAVVAARERELRIWRAAWQGWRAGWRR